MLQIGLPFAGPDSGLTLWNVGAAVVIGIIAWFGTYHAKEMLQHQVLAPHVDRPGHAVHDRDAVRAMS